MNIEITPPTHPMLPPGPSDGRRQHGVGWVGGDINIHIDINMNIDIRIIINMSRPQVLLARFGRTFFFVQTCFFLTKDRS